MPPTRTCFALSLCALLILAASLVAAYFVLSPSLQPPPPPPDDVKVQLRHDPGIEKVMHILRDSDEPDPHEQNEKKDDHGHVITPRIVNGAPVRDGAYPFFVRVDHNWYPTCGGSLVAPDVILTAAHCFPPEENTHLSVLINGYHDGPFEKEGQYYRDVIETVKHPDYKPTAWAYFDDLMLMRIDENVTEIPYITINRDTEQPEDDEEVTVMGLGALSEEGGYPSLLQAVDVGIVDHDTCSDAYEKVYLGPIVEETMVCAGSITDLPQDSCQGDSGGPMINQLGIQVGVISFGIGCARKGYPGVNARTSQKWLSDTLCDLTQSNALDEWCGKVDAKAAQHQTTEKDSLTTEHQTTEKDTLTMHQTTEKDTSTTYKTTENNSLTMHQITERESLTTLPPPLADDSEPDAQTLPSIIPRSTRPSVFINCGNSKNYTDLHGNVWISDKGLYNTGAKRYATRKSISNTDNQEIYQTERWGKVLKYTIPLALGEYFLSLHFAEIFSGSFRVDARVFSVSVQDEIIADHLDVYERAGDGNMPYILNKTIEVTDGSLTISFGKIKQSPKINAIEIHALGTSSNGEAALGDDKPTTSSAATTALPIGSQPPSDQAEMIQPIFINCGHSGSKAANYTDTMGNVWIPDNRYYNTGARKFFSAGDIANTQDPFIFQSERYSKTLTYTIPLPPLQYVVSLSFAEIFKGAFAEGSRIFDVFIQGEEVAHHFDIFQRAGGAGRTACILNTTVGVTDGTLTIVLSSVKQMAKISGISIYPSPVGVLQESLETATTTTTTTIPDTTIDIAEITTEDARVAFTTISTDPVAMAMTCDASLLSTVPATCNDCINCCPKVLQCPYFIFIETYMSYDDCLASLCPTECLRACPSRI